MRNTSLVLGIRRYSFRLALIGLAACGATLHVQAGTPGSGSVRPATTLSAEHQLPRSSATDETLAEPMSLLLLGAGLAAAASRLRRYVSKHP
jgi:hypothetical protein